jgi:hypothetical protein
MRGVLLILLMLACAADSSDARRHRKLLRDYDAATPVEPGARPPSQSDPTLAPDQLPDRRGQRPMRLAPADWREETADPALKGQRFISPDGNAWFLAYTLPAGEEGMAGHMKAVAFAEGEQVTYLRGERTWIAVAGFKQGASSTAPRCSPAAATAGTTSRSNIRRPPSPRCATSSTAPPPWCAAATTAGATYRSVISNQRSVIRTPTVVIARESGRSRKHKLSNNVTTVVTGCPASAGHDESEIRPTDH